MRVQACDALVITHAHTWVHLSAAPPTLPTYTEHCQRIHIHRSSTPPSLLVFSRRTMQGGVIPEQDTPNSTAAVCAHATQYLSVPLHAGDLLVLWYGVVGCGEGLVMGVLFGIACAWLSLLHMEASALSTHAPSHGHTPLHAHALTTTHMHQQELYTAHPRRPSTAPLRYTH